MVINQISKRKEERSIHNFQYGNKIVEYILIKSKRRKTCEVTVDKNEIVLRAPFDISINEVEKLLTEKINWISQKQKEINRLNPEIVAPVFENNSTLPFLGDNCILEIMLKQDHEDQLIFENNKFIVYLDNDHSSQKEIIKNLYVEWLNSKANEIFKEKVEKYSKIIAVNPKGIVIKNLKNRWGSLTKKGIIILNINLAKTPEKIIDYIIIHELCHFKIQGHSYPFWNYLKQFMPDYKRNIKWLERNFENLL